MENTEPKNIMESLLDEMNRVREIIAEYRSLPGGGGLVAAACMQTDVKKAEIAIASDDVIEVLQAYQQLKTWEI
jgi:hypothetical protein